MHKNTSFNSLIAFSENKLKLLSLLLQKEGVGSNVEQPIRRRNSSRPAPLSFGQQGLWFLSRLIPDSAGYNVSLIMRIEGDLDIGCFRRALTEVSRRHEILRTTFPILDGRPVQLISPPQSIVLPIIDLRELGEEREREMMQLTASDVQRPFDLAQGPVIRTSL